MGSGSSTNQTSSKNDIILQSQVNNYSQNKGNNPLSYKQEPIESNRFPLSLILLSLIKVQEIKIFIQENMSEIEKNMNTKLLKILCNLNKSTKLIDDCVNNFKKTFSDDIKKCKDLLSIYDYILKQLDAEIKMIGYRMNNISIMDLFYFKIKKTCQECKNIPKEEYSLLLDNGLLSLEDIELDLFCEHQNALVHHKVITNNIPKIIISFNNDLSQDRNTLGIIEKEYNLICKIFSKSLLYKINENYYEYDMENNTYKKIDKMAYDEISKNCLVYLYSKNEDNIESQVFTKIELFNCNKYKKAILDYINLKMNNKKEEKMFLINKEYFDYLLMMNDVDLSKFDMNNHTFLDNNILRNKLEILNMNKLIIYDEPDKIFGEVDFINETILTDLEFLEENYKGKEVRIIENIPKQIYQIIFRDNSILKLCIKNNKQILSFQGKINIAHIQSENNNENVINIKENKNNLEANKNELPNNNLNNNLNVQNPKIIDKKENEMKEKLQMIVSEIEKIIKFNIEMQNLVNKHIEDENKFEEYLIINKIYFNLIIKIFDSKEIYENDNIFGSFLSNISNIKTLLNDSLLKFDLFQTRKKDLSNEKIFNANFENIEIGSEKIEYPTDFIIIKENNLKEFLTKCDIKTLKMKKQLFKMIIGEGYVFIKDNNSQNNFFVCKNGKNMIFDVEIILKYKNGNEFIKDIRKYIKDSGFENFIKNRNIDLKLEKQEIINLEKENIGQLAIVSRYNPYIKGFFFSISTIKKLNKYFKEKEINKEQLSSLFLSYIKSDNQNRIKTNRLIKKVENKLSEITNSKLNYTNFKELIDCFLTNLDNELNTKKNEMIIKIEEDDQTFAFNKFRKEVENQNNSIIYKLFYGIKKITKNFQICKIENYSYELFKYLYFKIEKKENESPKDIISLIKSYENEAQTLKGLCSHCSKKDEDLVKTEEIFIYPEILIIIFDNESNAKINTQLSLKLKEDYFNLISCITRTKNDDDFAILYKEHLEPSKYFIFENNEKRDAGEQLNNLISNPYVLLYEKVDKKNKENETIIEEKEEDSNPPTFVNKNFQMGEIDYKNNNNFNNKIVQNSVNQNKMSNINSSINQNQIKENEFNQNININNMNNVNSNNISSNNINNININNNSNNNFNNKINPNNNMNFINNFNQNNNINNNFNQHQNINKSWNPMNNNNLNQNNNINQINKIGINQSMNNKNNFNFINQKNNNQINIMNNNMQNQNQMMNQALNQGNNIFGNINMPMNLNNLNMNNKNITSNGNINYNMNMNNNMNNQFNNNMNNINNNMNNQFNNQINNMNNNLNNNMNNQFNNQINNMNNNMNNQFNNNMNNINNNMNNQFNNNMNNNMNNNINNQFNNQFNNNMMNLNQNNKNGLNRFINNNNPQMMNMNDNRQFNNRFQMNNNQNQFMNQNFNQVSNNNKFMNQNNIPQNQNNFQNINQINNNMPMINNHNIQSNQIMNNNNFGNNNFNNQNEQINSNMNHNNLVNSNFNNNNINIKQENMKNNNNNGEEYLNYNPPGRKDEITIYFDFKNGKQIYIDVEKNIKFSEVIERLKEKYDWLNTIKIESFLCGGKKVDLNKTCEENNIVDSSKIFIIDI